MPFSFVLRKRWQTASLQRTSSQGKCTLMWRIYERSLFLWLSLLLRSATTLESPLSNRSRVVSNGVITFEYIFWQQVCSEVVL